MQVTHQLIEGARQAAKESEKEVKRLTALKEKAYKDCDQPAYDRFSRALEVWKATHENRLMILGNFLLEVYPEGARTG